MITQFMLVLGLCLLLLCYVDKKNQLLGLCLVEKEDLLLGLCLCFWVCDFWILILLSSIWVCVLVHDTLRSQLM